MLKKTITDIEGVFASGIGCGIKPDGKDLAYVFVPAACASAAVFTRNKVRAACIEYTARCLANSTLKAVIINSGNANAVTGEQGLSNAERTADIAASLFSLKPGEIAVASTGVIGKQLPMEKIEQGLHVLLQNPRQQQGTLAAESIMTTDTFPKQVFVTKQIGAGQVTVAGMAKGSGMIAPNMGTMLSFVVTDAAVDQATLQSVLGDAVDKSFNMVSVDTDTSTNDMVLMFGTGQKHISSGEQEGFAALVTEACIALAKMIAADGEGATKLIEVSIQGAATREQAKKLALNVVSSPLLKAAVHGADPNWGRVLMALGKDPALEVDPQQVDLYFGAQQILSKGRILDYKTDQVRQELQGKEVAISVNLNLGRSDAVAWGCDLTKEYVEINTHYT
jgi:glutamate N-acetyltransferase / amino-acid N-acetyltransferase